MSEWSDRIDDLVKSVQQQRDELRVQMHLAKADAKDEWVGLEKKVDRFLADAEAQSKPLRGAVADSAKDVGTALELVGDEIRKSYERVRDLLTKQEP
jgi:hypothetical protein